jgi:hypothetical protein
MEYKQTFPSIGDLLTFLNEAKSPARSSKTLKRDSDRDFYEFDKWEACLHHLQHGWQKGIDAVNATASRLEKEVGASVMREVFNPAVSGQFFDVGLVLSGEPECWLESDQDEKGSKCITISINASVSLCISTQTIIDRGAALCALVKLLETNGKSVKVVYGIGMHVDPSYKGDVIRCEVVLKSEGQPLDIDSLAFWLLCPDAFRRLMFRWLEEHSQFPRISGSYGFPDRDWTPEGQVRLPAIRSGETWSDSKTKEWLLKTLAEQGVSLQA